GTAYAVVGKRCSAAQPPVAEPHAIPASPDGLPMVGPASGAAGLWLLTGFGIDGMPLAPGTARLLTEHLVSGRRPAGAEPFAPERFDDRE
ncbi:FAD-dependent oxidoreductase, partial [Streptomyces olivaceoviridis]